jgi:hypothetical protein
MNNTPAPRNGATEVAEALDKILNKPGLTPPNLSHQAVAEAVKSLTGLVVVLNTRLAKAEARIDDLFQALTQKK